MYRDHRFLYVEPSSVYLHLYGTIYTVFMPLWCLFRILFYCYISDYPYACEEFWIVALSLHLRYQVLLIFKKYVGLNMFIIIASKENAVSKILEMHDEHNLIWLAIS